jgi:hypothetical protein
MNQETTEERCLRVAYEAATQHWIHAEETRWTLLYNYFMGTSILLIAWATIFTSHSPGRKVLLVSLALSGFAVSALWVLLDDRASTFVKMYSTLGRELEMSLGSKTNAEPRLSSPFIQAGEFREGLTGFRSLIASRFVVLGVPALFAILYLVLFYMALVRG